MYKLYFSDFNIYTINIAFQNITVHKIDSFSEKVLLHHYSSGK